MFYQFPNFIDIFAMVRYFEIIFKLLFRRDEMYFISDIFSLIMFDF